MTYAKRKRIFGLTLILLAFFATSASAQESFCSIKVRIVDATSKSELNDVNLRVINYDAKTIHYQSGITPGIFEYVRAGRLSISIFVDPLPTFVHRTTLKCPTKEQSPEVITVELSPKPLPKGRITRVRVADKENKSNKNTTVKSSQSQPINSGAIKLGKPRYPEAARAVRVSGVVEVSVIIDTEGNVVSAHAKSGHALLRRASERAAVASMFKVTRLDGEPVEVSGIIVYNFKK